jgi:hypothetical protein
LIALYRARFKFPKTLDATAAATEARGAAAGSAGTGRADSADGPPIACGGPSDRVGPQLRHRSDNPSESHIRSGVARPPRTELRRPGSKVMRCDAMAVRRTRSIWDPEPRRLDGPGSANLLGVSDGPRAGRHPGRSAQFPPASLAPGSGPAAAKPVFLKWFCRIYQSAPRTTLISRDAGE